MELTQLKYFRAVCKHEHFTRAAEELHIAQPSLSKAISNLEAELGVALFDRDNRSVHLNGYGQAFLRRAERVLAEMDEAVTEIQDMKSGEAGRIQIASAFLLDTPGQLAEFVGKFYFDHPRIHVHVFYQAMLIFFRKHYGHLSFLLSVPIKAAIYFRASIALFKMLGEKIHQFVNPHNDHR